MAIAIRITIATLLYRLNAPNIPFNNPLCIHLAEALLAICWQLCFGLWFFVCVIDQTVLFDKMIWSLLRFLRLHRRALFGLCGAVLWRALSCVVLARVYRQRFLLIAFLLWYRFHLNIVVVPQFVENIHANSVALKWLAGRTKPVAWTQSLPLPHIRLQLK